MMKSVAWMAAGLAMLGAAVPAMALEVAPHRALYVMSLESAKPNSGVIGASGTLAYEWGAACDGWTIEQRYKLAMQYDDEQPVEIGSSFITWESKDGLSYRFNERKTRNGQLDEEIKGDATLKSLGGEGKAKFTKPKEQTFDLPPGSYFPTAHTLMLIRKGESGEHFVPAHVFDGSEVDGAVLVSAVIGPVTSKPAESDIKSLLLHRPSWKMRLAFFSDANKQERPDYELGMRLLDNGVSSEMTIDYGDYVVKATLKEIEALPKPAC
jgi:hypothetical protein